MDDLYILSINDTALDEAKSFLGDHQHILKLNEARCSTISLENIRRDGFEMLGTVLGAREARERFINTKTDKLSAQLDHLHNLPHQHALQFLLRCYQQYLRYLQRSLATEDLPNARKRLDDRLCTEIKRLRGAEDGSFNGQLIAHPPARLGGLGVLNHQDISPHARAPIPGGLHCSRFIHLWSGQPPSAGQPPESKGAVPDNVGRSEGLPACPTR